MSIDSKTSYEKKEIFVKEILPALPFSITRKNHQYKIEITTGNIAYKCANRLLVEKSGKDNYEAGCKMLDWISTHDCHCRYKP